MSQINFRRFQLNLIVSIEDVEKRARVQLAFQRLLNAAVGKINNIKSNCEAVVSVPAIFDFSLFDLYYCNFTDVEGDYNYVMLKKGNTISPKFRLKYNGSKNILVIGDGVELGESVVQFNGRFGCVVVSDKVSFKECKIITAQKGSVVLIGSGVTWESGFVVVQEPDNYVLIGDDCFFSWEIGITPSDGHPIYCRRSGERVNPPSPVIIFERVWLGYGVRIGKGVTLGCGGVVDQMSLVTKSTKPYCLYAGVPARLLQENVEWRRSTKKGYSTLADSEAPY